MNTVELFCGTKSFSKVAQELGHNTFTIDFDPQHNPDLCKNILDLSVADIPFEPDIIWASPPCDCFSVASIGKYWNKDKTPKNDRAKLAIQILEKTVEFILVLSPAYFFIENPRGMMRNMECLKQFKRNTVTYCQYGDTRMKPTDIWTNSNIKFKPPCKNGDKCHVSAPRGSRTGTQGIDGKIARGVIPPQLFKDIFHYYC